MTEQKESRGGDESAATDWWRVCMCCNARFMIISLLRGKLRKKRGGQKSDKSSVLNTYTTIFALMKK